MVDGTNLDAFGALKNILLANKLFASKRNSITQYEPEGATCFYDIPPMMYQQVIDTNPNNRRGYGIIISKTTFWALGGRPVIYTDNTTPDYWPTNERFKLVYTDLCKMNPVDWTHEREWRMKGDLNLQQLYVGGYWWPCVEKIIDSQIILKSFPQISQIYIIELGKIINRNEIII